MTLDFHSNRRLDIEPRIKNNTKQNTLLFNNVS